MIEKKGMHLNHDFYVVVGKICRTENAYTGGPSTHFLYAIVYQQQHTSRDSNACLSVRPFAFCLYKPIVIPDVTKTIYYMGNQNLN